ncbi:MAG: NAD-dependent epimerase/dehydratase family protein, partial [Chlorobium limicola]|uniref:NAD-dependent epimerase/dehydratase family protein n=1 Tax=Chlorobium limicola TaxID=1092 RepID=UPI0023F25B8E
TPFHQRNQPYPDTKIAATRLIGEYAAKGQEISIVYPSMVYGPGDRTIFPLLADGIRKGQLFYWTHHTRMSLIYIDNLVDLVMLAATHPAAAGEGFLACDTTVPDFGAFCDRLASGIDARPPFIHLPFSLAYLLASLMEMAYRLTGSDTRPMLTRQAVTLLASRAMFDTSKARNQLGWNPKVSYDAGFRRTLDWLLGIDPREWKCK